MNKIVTLLLLAAISLLLPAPSFAVDARELLEKSEAMHRNSSLAYSGELAVVSRDGKVRSKSWSSYREGFAGEAKVLVRFTSPPEVKGVGFLSLGRTGKNADQWLYLPSMKRERRIAAQDRDSSFVGTDFSYEDMEEFDHRKYEVELMGDETVGGEPCYVVEALPAKDSGRTAYARRLLYLRKDILHLVRVDLFRADAKTPSKRLVLSEISQVEGRWIAHRLEMSDLAKGSRTTVVLKSVAVDRGHPADRFTLKNLTREGGD